MWAARQETFSRPIEQKRMPHKALHRTAIPLRSIAAGELGRYCGYKNNYASPLLGMFSNLIVE